jgi:hypothetical protein
MRKEEFISKVDELITNTGVSQAEAVAIVREQCMNEVEQRLQREEDKRNEATTKLLDNPESKTVLVMVHEFIPKEQALAIAHSTIKVNKLHFISQLVHGEKDTWLVASEFPINQADALKILENLTPEKYTHEEIEVIVENQIPFDLR